MKTIIELVQKGKSLSHRIARLAEEDTDGVWRTIRGRAIFIPTGSSLEDAMKKGGIGGDVKGGDKVDDKKESGSSGPLSKLDPHNAISLRNMMKSKYSLVPSKSIGESNPYSSGQQVSGMIKNKASADKLMEDLKSSGWKYEPGRTYGGGKSGEINPALSHFTKGEGKISIDKFNDGRYRVDIHGKKSAKRSNLPYYD